MALFSVRHSVKTFSEKRQCESRKAEFGQTYNHVKYITRKAAARIVGSNIEQDINFNMICKQYEEKAYKSKGRVCERIIIALPIEASCNERKDLIEGFCKSLCGSCCKYIYAIHDKAGNDKSNPHAHLILFDEKIKNGGRGRPSSYLGFARKGAIEELTARWANYHNIYMTNAGYGPLSQIDQRSYKERGVLKIPQLHEGVVTKMKIQPKSKFSWIPIDGGVSRSEVNDLINEINGIVEGGSGERERLGAGPVQDRRERTSFTRIISSASSSSGEIDRIPENESSQNGRNNGGKSLSRKEVVGFKEFIKSVIGETGGEKNYRNVSGIFIDYMRDGGSRLYSRLYELRRLMASEQYRSVQRRDDFNVALEQKRSPNQYELSPNCNLSVGGNSVRNGFSVRRHITR